MLGALFEENVPTKLTEVTLSATSVERVDELSDCSILRISVSKSWPLVEQVYIHDNPTLDGKRSGRF